MVKGIMGSGAGTSFIANITEPVEFSFMFLSPMLYVIHALFAGLAGIVCYLFNIRIGFTFEHVLLIISSIFESLPMLF